MINKIFNGNAKTLSINYDFSLYKCTVEEFRKELDDLRDKLIICGIGK